MQEKDNKIMQGNDEHDYEGEIIHEVIQDIFLSYFIFSIQKKCKNIYLQEILGYLGLMTCSLLLNELLKSEFTKYINIPEESKNLLNKLRNRLLKQSVQNDSRNIKSIVSDMGIDYNHYCYDMILTVNTKRDNELLAINFSLWDILKMDEEDLANFNSLTYIPEIIVKKLFSDFYKDNIYLYSEIEKYCTAVAMALEKKIVPEKYQYASGVFFKDLKICEEDIKFILFYYTYSKLIYMMDDFVPFEVIDIGTMHIDLKYSKMKLKAAFIETIGYDIKGMDTPVVNEIKSKLEDINKNFFHSNRNLRNNLHYNKKTVLTNKDLELIEEGQVIYLQVVQDILHKSIKFKFGATYRMIKWVANHTDSNIKQAKIRNKIIE